MVVAVKNEKGIRLIDCRKAADTYGCTMSYIRRLARDGRLDSQVVAGSYLFDETQVRRLAAEAAGGKGRHKKRAGGFKPG